MNPTFARRSSTTVLAVAMLATGVAGSATGARGTPPERLPAASEFVAGTCTRAAEPVLAVAKLAARYKGAPKISPGDRRALTKQQDSLAKLVDSSDSAVRKPLRSLVTSIGFVRLRHASRTYDPALLDSMDAARRNVQQACVQ